MKLSILVPAYNERGTIEEILRRVKAVSLSIAREIVVVDDASTDGTWDILQKIDGLVLRRHEKNRGKGAAVRTAASMATGDILLVQDADLEYHPEDYPVLLGPILDNRADVVYGSRFLGGPHRVHFFWHYLANTIFTFLTNILYNVNLTDMGVGYKVFRKEVLAPMSLKSDRFGFEPEVTAKICKAGRWRIYEVPISYSGRSYAEGKKITWKDGLSYLGCLLRYRFFN